MTIKIHDKSDKTYVVVGAPGSATSFISKALEEQGVEMGNEDKFYQNKEFEQLNREILGAAGGGGANPPHEEMIMLVDADSKIKKLIKKFKKRFWGWKDPQTSFTLKKYLPHLDGDVYLICTFRKPKHHLNKLDWYRSANEAENKELLDKYNLAIIDGIKEFCEL